jgi:hypothetical protein
MTPVVLPLVFINIEKVIKTLKMWRMSSNDFLIVAFFHRWPLSKDWKKPSNERRHDPNSKVTNQNTMTSQIWNVEMDPLIDWQMFATMSFVEFKLRFAKPVEERLRCIRLNGQHCIVLNFRASVYHFVQK